MKYLINFFLITYIVLLICACSTDKKVKTDSSETLKSQLLELECIDKVEIGLIKPNLYCDIDCNNNFKEENIKTMLSYLEEFDTSENIIEIRDKYESTIHDIDVFIRTDQNNKGSTYKLIRHINDDTKGHYWKIEKWNKYTDEFDTIELEE